MKKFGEDRSEGLKKRDLRSEKNAQDIILDPAVEIEADEPQEAVIADAVPEQAPEAAQARPRGPSEGKGSRRPRPQVAKGDSEFLEKVVAINRITKVTKGGKKLSFSALVVVGDARGNVGYSLEKASEVSIAIRKAITMAKKAMVNIPMKGTTIPHEIIGECGAAKVLLKPASEGTGVIAAGPVRAICDGAGIRNILTKCHRSNNPVNVVKATMDGLSRLKSVSSQG